MQHCTRVLDSQIQGKVTKRSKLDGRGCKIRTYDPLLPKQMRYLAALSPVVHRTGEGLGGDDASFKPKLYKIIARLLKSA
jgi:hypothetical protein